MTTKRHSNIHEAASHGDIDALCGFVKSGSSIDARDDIAMTPLMRAAYDNQPASVEYLLSKGADINAVDEDGWGALPYAISNGHHALACLLIASGAFAQVEDFGPAGVSPISLDKILPMAMGLDAWNAWLTYQEQNAAMVHAGQLSEETAAAAALSPARPRL
jgi:hypothetical protein